MGAKGSNAATLGVVAMIVVLVMQGSAGEARMPSWPSVTISHPVARRKVVAALDAAAVQLDAPRCRALLTEFSDRDGRPLATTLDRLRVDVSTYVTLVTFIDGSRDATCSGSTLAFTTPGSRVVRVCANSLASFSTPRHDYVTAAFIHEILHTLGLGENPPSSAEITARVLASCPSVSGTR